MTPNLPEIVSRDEWLAARRDLLEKEKRLTRERDAVNADRRRLLSALLRDGDRVFHTYSTDARGTDHIGFIGAILDSTALGRQEEWEEPKGRATPFGAKAGSPGVRYHDEY